MKKILLLLLTVTSVCSATDRGIKHHIKLGTFCLIGAYVGYKVAESSFNNPGKYAPGLVITGLTATGTLATAATYHICYKTLEHLLEPKSK